MQATPQKRDVYIYMTSHVSHVTMYHCSHGRHIYCSIYTVIVMRGRLFSNLWDEPWEQEEEEAESDSLEPHPSNNNNNNAIHVGALFTQCLFSSQGDIDSSPFLRMRTRTCVWPIINARALRAYVQAPRRLARRGRTGTGSLVPRPSRAPARKRAGAREGLGTRLPYTYIYIYTRRGGTTRIT